MDSIKVSVMFHHVRKAISWPSCFCTGKYQTDKASSFCWIRPLKARWQSGVALFGQVAHFPGICMWLGKAGARAPSQYPKRHLIVRSREVSKPRDLYLELSDRSEIWQALRQHCCRCACQISKWYDNLKYQSHGFESSRDLTTRRLFG